ncbi:MAG: leucine-rich repeat protein [Alistipes ihumii]|uniref:leucine-rich repeat protein n=1 Tax=Alistipes ihumii TaxID=1470347 RepID=UPI00265D7E94|nr:leucine-rich repeat protein [Alistipes ihumii]
MKKIVTLLIFGLMSLASCTEYDEVAMWNKNEDMGSRLAALERLCDRMNTNIASLQRIVEALQANDYVTGVAPVVENGETIGYTISFSRSGPVTIYHGKDGQSGATPVIGVKQDTDGLYYWTLDGEWLEDSRGDRVVAQGPAGRSAYELAVENGYRGTLEEWLASLNGNNGLSAYELAVENGYRGTEEEWLASLKGTAGDKGDDGNTPKLKIENGYWYVSYGDDDWVRLGQATGEDGRPGQDGDSMFSDIDVSDPDFVVLTLAETGERIRLPRYREKFDLLFEKSDTEKVKEMEIACGAGETAEVRYELTPAEAQVAIECISHSAYKVSVDEGDRRILVSAPDDPAAVADPRSEILVFASDDERTIMRKLVVKQAKYIRYRATEQLRVTNESFPGDPYFRGKECEFIDGLSSYDPVTGEGKWGYTGTVTQVEPGAFGGETALQSLTLPEGIEYIGSNAFNNSGLEEIVLPETLVEIDQFAFSKTRLTEVVIPGSVELLRASAFEGKSNGGSPLEKVVFEGNKIRELELRTFSYCDRLKEIALPEGLESIGYNAFDGCSALERIDIPASVTYVGEAAFVYCTGLKEAVIGDGVAEIAKRAFAECTALKRVVIGRGIRRIGDMAFNTRSSWDQMTLESVTVLFDDISSGDFPVLESGQRGVFPKPGGWDPVSYKIYVPQGTGAVYRAKWADYSSLIQEK